MGTKLSILIISLAERKQVLARLLNVLMPQITDECQLLLSVCGRGETTGSRRNRLFSIAKGRFACFIDDDDLVAEDYIERILAAIKSNPSVDAIGFAGAIKTPSGKTYRVRYTVENRNRIGHRKGVFECFVGHLTPIRLDILRQLKFENRTFGEDSQFCELLKPLCQTEVYIDKPMYFYLTRTEV
jgi:glycosyltransferase involved in cell wall biosynthesis